MHLLLGGGRAHRNTSVLIDASNVSSQSSSVVTAESSRFGLQGNDSGS
jgi:hypothetical protein